MDIYNKILEVLPYSEPFLFVDHLYDASDSGISGTYRLKEDEYFYKGHFQDYPVTPGVILVEIAAQIGLVCLGIYYLINENKGMDYLPKFSQADVNFLKPVFPGTKLTVISEKVYFRFGKLKCKVKVLNEKSEVVCDGFLSGFLISNKAF